MPKIETGDSVVIILHSPREKFWGVLRELSPTGAFARGIDLNAFDEFARAVRNGEMFYGMSEMFFPMWRIERVSRDENNGDILSMSEQFKQRTGYDIADFDEAEPEAPIVS